MRNDFKFARAPVAPCKDCTDRHYGCHSTCKKYSEWKNNYEEERESKLNNSMKTCIARAFLIEQNLKGKINREKKKNK